MPPVAVTTITGWSKPRARISTRVSWPDMPGMTRSSRTTSAGAAGRQALDRLVAALGVGDREALALEDRLDQPTLRRIVIDDEDRFGHLKTPTVDRPLASWTRAPVVTN